MERKNWMIADLHIHSKYSRATSFNLSFENLAKWGKIKGIDLLGTGDFTHPTWFEEIKKLRSNNKGFYCYQDFAFVISGEISLIYTQDGKGRRVHIVVLVPSIEIAEKINSYLDTKGRRDYDGRPIFKIPCDEFTKELKVISEDIEIIPAHIWTPWFSLFGSMSGFDSLKQAFKDQEKHIYAIETGMSSDPEMNWRIKELENKAIVSFSDSHSFWPWRLGREATVFEKTDSYKEVVNQIRENSFIATIEVDPNYGKYHWDGHRNCNFSCSPEKTKEINGICPVCKRKLTLGVEYRIEELASYEQGHKIQDSKPFYTLLPLHEIISVVTGTGMQTSRVWKIYNDLIAKFENEFNILFDVTKEEFLGKNVEDKLIELILKNRQGKIKVQPGFDGEYGKVLLEEKQSTL